MNKLPFDNCYCTTRLPSQVKLYCPDALPSVSCIFFKSKSQNGDPFVGHCVEQTLHYSFCEAHPLVVIDGNHLQTDNGDYRIIVCSVFVVGHVICDTLLRLEGSFTCCQ